MTQPGTPGTLPYIALAFAAHLPLAGFLASRQPRTFSRSKQLKGDWADAAERILVIEDQADLRLLMAHSLRAVGYDVEDVAATADEASRRLDIQFYGVVVADWRLPDSDGIELAGRPGSAPRP